MSNPFDLARKRTFVEEKPPQQHQPANQHNPKLVGYIGVPQNQWLSIPPGTHIRYYSVAGDFRTGGFVRSIDGDRITLETDKINRSGPNYKQFRINVADVSAIYKKMPVARPPPVQYAPQQQQYAPQQQYEQYEPIQQPFRHDLAEQVFRDGINAEIASLKQRILVIENKIDSIVELFKINKMPRGKKN